MVQQILWILMTSGNLQHACVGPGLIIARKSQPTQWNGCNVTPACAKGLVEKLLGILILLHGIALPEVLLGSHFKTVDCIIPLSLSLFHLPDQQRH